MRAIVWIAEGDGDAMTLEYKYMDLLAYWKDLAITFGFDKVICLDKSGTPYIRAGSGGGQIVEEVYTDWAAIRAAYPTVKFICPVTNGGVMLKDFVEPAGDIIYALGGDYSNANNFQGTPDAKVTVESQIGGGTWSFFAMACIAHDMQSVA